jgi:enoyl-CoA hydratase
VLSLIHHEDHGSVTVLRIEYGKANTIDLELSAELGQQLEKLKSSPARAVVLTGTGSIFSAGVDLFRIVDGGAAYLDEFLPAMVKMMETLFTFPKPVIAAVNGHAIAGGCILVCACDLRVMADGPGKIGVPELRVGVPFPTLALEILRFAVPERHLQELVYTGRTYTPAEALQRGLVNEIIAPEALLDRACELGERLGAIPSVTFQVTKRQLRGPVLERVEQHGPAIDAEVTGIWASSAVQAVIRDYLQRTLGKSS